MTYLAAAKRSLAVAKRSLDVTMTDTLFKSELTLVFISLCIFLTGIILIAFNFHILGIIFYIVGHVVGSLAYSSFRRGLLGPASASKPLKS